MVHIQLEELGGTDMEEKGAWVISGRECLSWPWLWRSQPAQLRASRGAGVGLERAGAPQRGQWCPPGSCAPQLCAWVASLSLRNSPQSPAWDPAHGKRTGSDSTDSCTVAFPPGTRLAGSRCGRTQGGAAGQVNGEKAGADRHLLGLLGTG